MRIRKTTLLRKKVYLTAFITFISGTFYFSYAQTQTVFAVVGDYGSKDKHEQDVANLIDNWNPAFVLTVGDNVYTNSYPNDVGKYYHKYMYPHEPTYGDSDTTTFNHFWPVVGNHDWDVNDLEDFIDYFQLPNNERYYNKRIGDMEFFFIDSDTREDSGTSSNSKQANWIHQQISASTALWKIVLFHHPAYCSGGSKTYMQWPFENWGVDVVLQGHVHVYERIARDDNHDNDSLVYFVDGLGGDSEGDFDSSPVSGSKIRYNSDYGAMKVTESESKNGDTSSIAFQFYNTSATKIDDYTLTKTLTPTPVQLTTFSANQIGNNSIRLNWSTATEINNFGFDIEKSVGNSSWLKIGFVAGSGNSNSTKNYSFEDNPTGGSAFNYRLKQIDVDGSYKYYDAISVSLSALSSAKLLQNNPNPFNPSTAIKFYIPNTANVTIKIYDLLGREVKTLLDEQTGGGYHVVYWNGEDSRGRDVSSGIYFYMLRTENFVETKKMNLLK